MNTALQKVRMFWFPPNRRVVSRILWEIESPDPRQSSGTTQMKSHPYWLMVQKSGKLTS